MAMGILKGIGSLLKRKPKPNRRLTPEEIAKRDLMEAKQATQAAKGRYEKASTQLDEVLKPYKTDDEILGEYMRYKYASPVRSPGSTAMRAKKVGDETMEMIKDSVMKMDLPPAKKVEAIKSAATAVRNADSAALAKANPAQLSRDIIKMINTIKMIGAGGAGFVGGAMMEGAAREGRLPEMIQDSFLVKPEFRGMRDTGDAVGKMLGATMMEPEQSLWERNSQISDAPRFMFEETAPGIGPWDRMTLFGSGYDEPDPEPGLEEGSIADLLLFNRLFGD